MSLDRLEVVWLEDGQLAIVEAANAAPGTGKIRQQLYSKSANLTRGNIVSSVLTVGLVTWSLHYSIFLFL